MIEVLRFLVDIFWYLVALQCVVAIILDLYFRKSDGGVME